MPSETTDMRRPVKNQPTDPGVAATMQPPKPTDLLPCPRCGSASTKFCYYNNYNLSQPRYFCKGCRRYWTQGGTLRCVPVGGGTRKSGSISSTSSASKRSRSSSASSTTTTSTNSSNSTTSNSTTTTTTHEPVPVSASGSEVHHPEHVKVENTIPYELNLNEKFQPVMNDCTGNFMSLLNCQEPPVLGMGMNGYGSGFGYGFYDMGLGFGGRGGGAGVWSYPGIGNGNVTDGVAGVGGAGNPGCNTWQVGHDVGGNGSGNGNGGAGGVDDGEDYFGWPGLAISTPGKALK